MSTAKSCTQRIFTGHVAGVSFATPDVDILNDGDEVELVHEPTNPFDDRAVRVDDISGQKLGYLPKDSTDCYFDAVENDFEITATIRSIDNSGKSPKIRINVSIQLNEEDGYVQD